jgi:hypothetical protein
VTAHKAVPLFLALDEPGEGRGSQSTALCRDSRQIAICRPVYDTARLVVPRTMAWAVPRLLGIIPPHDTTQVSADRRALVKLGHYSLKQAALRGESHLTMGELEFCGWSDLCLQDGRHMGQRPVISFLTAGGHTVTGNEQTEIS